MKVVICTFIMFFMFKTWAEPSICKQTSILKENDDIYYACGAGRASIKIQAERNAYESAIDVINAYCASSIDCKNKKYSITPQRVTCSKEDLLFRCTRLLEIRLINVIEIETKTDLFFSLDISIIQDHRYRSADYDLGILVDNRINRYSLLFSLGYHYSNINTKVYDTVVDYNYYKGIDYTGLNLGFGLGYNLDSYVVQILKFSANLNSKQADSMAFKEHEVLPRNLNVDQLKVNFFKNISDRGRAGLSIAEISNSFGVRANSIGFVYQYKF